MTKAVWRNVQEGDNWHVPTGGYLGVTSCYTPRANACCRDGNVALVVGGNGTDCGFISIILPGGNPTPAPLLPPVWPTKLYVATRSAGVYYTTTFTDPTDATQPVWTAVNGGLGVLTIRNLDIDPFNPVGRQVCLTATEQNCYIRYGSGDWQSLITQAQFRALTHADAIVQWVTFDRAIQGRVWVCGARVGAFDSYIYALFSDDDGASWTVRTTESHIFRGVYQLYASGDNLWMATNEGIGGGAFIRYSANAGVGWAKTALLGASIWDAYTWYNPLDGLCYTAGNGISGPDLVSVDTLLNVTVLQDALNLGGTWQTNDSQTMWHSAESAGYQRILDNSCIYTTLDSWATVVDPAPAELIAGWKFDSLVAPLASNEDWMILGPRAVAGGQQHIIYTLDGDTGIPTGKAGSDPVGGVNSIPMAAVGLALNGIGIVE